MLVVATDDADRSDVDAVTWLLGAADARDAGTLTLTERFLAQDSAAELTSVIADVFPDQASGQSAEDAPNPGAQAGEAFGTA